MSDIRSTAYTGARPITVSDATADPAGPFAAIYVGAAGSVKLETTDGYALTFVGVPAGSILPINCTRVWSTGTTVSTPNTNIIGLKAYPVQAV
jgi:hypothetical protein